MQSEWPFFIQNNTQISYLADIFQDIIIDLINKIDFLNFYEI